tara:strand:- start:156 stop:707 length:552 start_codon:yes stop_codon:yes gene_type:complete
VIIDKDVFTSNEKEFVRKNILSEIFPWYFIPNSVVTQRSGGDGVNFFGHTLVKRFEHRKLGEELHQSSACDFFMPIIDRFFKKHKLKYKEILRGSINLLYPQPVRQSAPHVDHNFPHNQIICYLNESDGDTVVLKKEKGKRLKYKEFARVSPEPFKILYFGYLPHYVIHPTSGRRIVLVMTFK